MIANIIGLIISVFVVFGGLAVIRLGKVGRYLDRFRFVSYIKNNEEPKPFHRYATATLGLIFLIIGTMLFCGEIFLLSKMK